MEDRRVRKSKSALKCALLELMKGRPVSGISVVSLCFAADVNRSTFYANYQDIYALLQDIYEDLFHKVDSLMASLIRGTEDPTLLLPFIRHLEDHKDLFQLLCINNEDRLFERNMLAYCTEKYDSSEKEDVAGRYAFSYNISGSISVFCQWVHEGFPCSSEELAYLLVQFPRFTSISI